MHLMDGSIPMAQAAAYGVASGAVVSLGIRNYYKCSKENPHFKFMSGAFAAFVFITTVFEIPMPFGSTEHPTGTPVMAIFMGPLVTAFLSLIVLVLELLFKEGGITTLGANVLSLGIIGGFAGWGIFHLFRRLKLGIVAPAFLAGFFGDLLVYCVTASQLALGNMNGKSIYYYFFAFVPVQVPLALIEGVFTALVVKFAYDRRREFLEDYKVLR